MLKSSHLGLINDIRISDQWQEKPADCWWKCASSCRNAENGSSNDLSFGWHHDPRRRKLVPKGKHLEKKERGHFQNHRQHKVTPFFNWGWPFSWDLDKKAVFFRVSELFVGDISWFDEPKRASSRNDGLSRDRFITWQTFEVTDGLNRDWNLIKVSQKSRFS